MHRISEAQTELIFMKMKCLESTVRAEQNDNIKYQCVHPLCGA